MPYVSSIGTHLPCRGGTRRRVPGDDEDAVTLAHLPVSGLGMPNAFVPDEVVA